MARHNKLASLTADLFRLGWALGLRCCIEQPASSLLFRFGPIAQVLKDSCAKSVAVRMSSFCGDSCKPLVLKGIGDWLLELHKVARVRNRHVPTQSKRPLAHNCAKGYTGIPRALAASSSYTACFGFAIACALADQSASQIAHELVKLGH